MSRPRLRLPTPPGRAVPEPRPGPARRGAPSRGAPSPGPGAASTAVQPSEEPGGGRNAVTDAGGTGAAGTGAGGTADAGGTAAAGEGVVELVARAQAGDPEAFGLLYDRYVDLVYRYIYYRVGTRQLAEDLVSETFLRALRRITTFTWQGRDFAAWLVTIARNLIADHYKSGRYRLEITTADMLESADRVDTATPEAEVITQLGNAALLDAVRKLNPEQQECIALRFLQGLSVSETALAMGKNDGAIKALQYRAVRSLGRLLPEGMW